MNSCQLHGDVIQEPRFNRTGETAVGNFSLAVPNPFRKNAQGYPETQWFQVSVWGKQAEALEKLSANGLVPCSMIVEGRIEEPDLYPSKQTGEYKASLRVRAGKFEVTKWPPRQEQQKDSGVPF